MKSNNRLQKKSLLSNIQVMGNLFVWFVTGCAVILTACGKKEEPPPKEVSRPVKVVTITSWNEALSQTYPGRVRAYRRADLSFKVSGRLNALPVEEGQKVKKSKLLARLDPRDFEAKVQNVEGQLAKARSALKLAKVEYERVLNIQKADPGAVSQSMVDQRREGVERAEAEIQSLQATLDAANLELSYTYLRAPFDGVVSKRYVENFQDVQAKEPIVHMDDVSTVEILVDVPEMLIATVRQGISFNIFAEFAAAQGKQYPLSIYEYSTRADPRTQTYQVTLRMPQPEEINVLAGMTANVLISSESLETDNGRYIIPAIAVFADAAGKANVWVVDPEKKRVQRRIVTPGDLTGSASIEIIEGLENGEMIAVSGVSRLRENMLVRPVDKIEF
ncbi:MAG: efflux RND transporter periplasmic adaptor subunit [Deltaproteobacteria bacterium]|nr:MAG: efflux RND transporter periplasmic adaptor subunit [Deltaproteobacteria bacterium]